MEAIEFKLKGKMAHFRKYYSNSTALSYYIPPVTTIKGIIAGLLGYDRDTYYEEFQNKNCMIAISLDNRIRKITQTMNLLKVEKPSELSGSGIHSQNNTEWIIPENIRTGEIAYNIIFYHSNIDIMKNLESCVCNHADYYSSKGISIALGSAQCLGWIQSGHIVDLEHYEGPNFVVTKYAVTTDQIESAKPYNGNFSLIKEETITEFNKDRYITQGSKKNIILSSNGIPITYQLKFMNKCWIIKDANSIEEKTIVFI